MMSLNDLISPQAVVASLKANSKKQALIELSEKAAELSGIDSREVLDALIQRERLGSTGIGGGIAIPHGKLAKCHRIFGVFARLEKPIDFEALDDAPVDLVFLLVAPENAGAPMPVSRMPEATNVERSGAAESRVTLTFVARK